MAALLALLALGSIAPTAGAARTGTGTRSATAHRAHGHTHGAKKKAKHARHVSRKHRRHRKHHKGHRAHPHRLASKHTKHDATHAAGAKGSSTAPGATTATASDHDPSTSPGESSTQGPGATPLSPSNPFAGQTLYVDPNSSALATQRAWASQGRAADAAQLGKIASRPVARWFGNWSYGHGGTAGDVSSWIGQASAAHALPVLVAYDIPWRDCNQYSAGGAGSAAGYRQFVDGMSQGIAGRRAVVIVEPDALAELQCLSAGTQTTYYELLNYAVSKLGSNPLVSVYLDAGNAHWQPTATIAARLRQAGVAHARGFSLNVSNFDTTASERGYGDGVALALGTGAHFVIDTGRNGQGPAAGGAWCNPAGRGLGAPPTTATGDPLADAFLWVKQPGNSDGTCNGGPAAGQFWPDYALGLAQRSVG